MNKSYSKIRHIQESNMKLETRRFNQLLESDDTTSEVNNAIKLANETSEITKENCRAWGKIINPINPFKKPGVNFDQSKFRKLPSGQITSEEPICVKLWECVKAGHIVRSDNSFYEMCGSNPHGYVENRFAQEKQLSDDLGKLHQNYINQNK